MKKRFFSALIMCCILLAALPMASYAAEEETYCSNCGDRKPVTLSYEYEDNTQHHFTYTCTNCGNVVLSVLTPHISDGTPMCTKSAICIRCGVEYGNYGHTWDTYGKTTYCKVCDIELDSRDISRGQSMYGDSDVGIAVTALVTGLALGCMGTVGWQKIKKRKGSLFSR